MEKQRLNLFFFFVNQILLLSSFIMDLQIHPTSFINGAFIEVSVTIA